MRKIISVILAFVVLALSFSLTAFATTEATLTLSGENVYAGEEFKIQLLISDNSKMSGAVIDVNYDSRMLEFISAEKGGVLDVNANISINKIDEDTSKIRFTYLAPSSSVTAEGVVMTMNFKAMPSANGETNLTISIPSAGDFVTEDLEKISYTLVNSKVVITNTSLEATEPTETEAQSENKTDNTTDESSSVELTTEPSEKTDDKENDDLLSLFILLAVGVCLIGFGIGLLISSNKKKE